MGLLSIARRMPRRAGGSGARERQARHSGGPKNGPLTLAVVGAIVAMIGLSALNYRLISDPSVGRKAFGTSARSGKESLSTPERTKRSPSRSGPSHRVPPKVTFYRQLTQADEEPSRQEGDSRGAQPEDCIRQILPGSAKRDESEPVACPSTSATVSHRSDLPSAEAGPSIYTVQVGAFTDPGVAQQWAQKWKARGYNVSLRPVARPRAGVIYRLYLGKFSSRKTADELVQRLKHKEGIRAFPLVVHN
jgi:hypothetical protein